MRFIFLFDMENFTSLILHVFFVHFQSFEFGLYYCCSMFIIVVIIGIATLLDFLGFWLADQFVPKIAQQH